MDDGHRPDEEEVSVATVSGDGEFGRVLAQQFALFRLPGFDHVRLDAGADYVGFSHVANSEQQKTVVRWFWYISDEDDLQCLDKYT